MRIEQSLPCLAIDIVAHQHEKSVASSSAQITDRHTSPEDIALQCADVEQVAAVKNNTLQKSDLSPGDILLLVDQPDNTSLTHKIIKNGQRLPALSILRQNKGEPCLVHALMWSKTQKNPQPAEEKAAAEPEIVEMAGRNLNSSISGNLRGGLYKVYSPKDKNLGDWAAQIGLMWSDERGISYSKRKSVLSVVKNSSFKSIADKESARYGMHAFENNPPIRGAFCSHFVLATYQAAAKNIGLPFTGALKVDAEATSVRTLEHFLKKDRENFEYKGYLKITTGK